MSRLEAEKLLYFSIVLISSSLENGAHTLMSLPVISSRSWKLTLQDWAELKELWKVSHRLSNSIQGRPLNWIDSTAESFHFLTQFISSHGLHFLLVISVILSSKNMCFDFLTVFLNSFQSLRLWDCQYLLRLLWQLSFHYVLECLIMLTFLEYLIQMFSILMASIWTIFSRASMLWIKDVSILLMKLTSSSKKYFSLSLFLIRGHFQLEICLSKIEILTEMGAWSNINL